MFPINNHFRQFLSFMAFTSLISELISSHLKHKIKFRVAIWFRICSFVRLWYWKGQKISYFDVGWSQIKMKTLGHLCKLNRFTILPKKLKNVPNNYNHFYLFFTKLRNVFKFGSILFVYFEELNRKLTENPKKLKFRTKSRES